MPKLTSPLKVTFIGRYANGPTDIVRCIFLGLQELGHTVQEINVSRTPGRLLYNPHKRVGGNGPVYVRHAVVGPMIEEFQPDVILLCAGGLTFDEGMESLKRRAPVVGVTLSDPDVFPTVSPYAGKFTVHTTNSVAALERYRALGHTNTVLMPFAVDSRFFVPRRPVPELQADVAVIGHGRPDRYPVVKRLRAAFKTRVYGRNWPKAWSQGPVQGEDWFRAAYSVRFLVNFPRTAAGHTNVKVGVFEATATGRLLFTEYFDEMRRYFKYDTEIVGYRDADDLVAKVKYYLDHPDEAERIAEAGQLRCASDHTWARRLSTLFDALAPHLKVRRA